MAFQFRSPQPREHEAEGMVASSEALAGKAGNYISKIGIILSYVAARDAVAFYALKQGSAKLNLPRGRAGGPCGIMGLGSCGQMSNLAPTGFGLTTSVAWGTSNFLGGFASQRVNPFLLAMISNLSGLSILLVLAAVLRAPALSTRGQIWSLLAGTAGGLALAILYGSLSSGHMGMASPVVAVLSVGIPAAVTIVRVGSPGLPRLLGFALALLGVSLIGKTDDKTEKRVLGMALLAGCGFAAYSLAIKQAGPGSAIRIEVNSRLTAFFMTAVVTLWRKKFRDLQARPALWASTAGWLDIAGSIAFIRASQTGRLDTAVVLASLYPAVTVSLAVVLLKERLTVLKAVGLCAALAALPLIVG